MGDAKCFGGVGGCTCERNVWSREWVEYSPHIVDINFLHFVVSLHKTSLSEDMN